MNFLHYLICAICRIFPQISNSIKSSNKADISVGETRQKKKREGHKVNNWHLVLEHQSISRGLCAAVDVIWLMAMMILMHAIFVASVKQLPCN